MATGVYVRSAETRQKMRERMTGHVWSEASKEKVRKWKLGTRLSAEGREKLRVFHTGLKHSEATKKKISLVQIGRKISLERLPQMRLVMLGERNPNWQGGITTPNQRARASLEYRQWSRSVLERDDFRCRMPGCLSKRGCELNAHHIKRFVDFPELRFVISNGISLCVPCHDKTKAKEKDFEALFTSLLS